MKKNLFHFFACVSPQMAQLEERLAVAAPAQAPAAPPALPHPVESLPPPARPSEESSDDSSDRRKKEKKEKKKKKRERRERERSQGLGGGGYRPAWGGGVKEEGEGEVVVDEGNVDGEEGEGLEVVDTPMRPPSSPSGSSKPWAPSPLLPRRKAGAIPWSAQVLEQGFAGGQPVFSSPAHSHMTVMSIFRRLIRCLIRRNAGEHRGTRGKDASRWGGGLQNPSLVPRSPPCLGPPVWAVCPH